MTPTDVDDDRDRERLFREVIALLPREQLRIDTPVVIFEDGDHHLLYDQGEGAVLGRATLTFHVHAEDRPSPDAQHVLDVRRSRRDPSKFLIANDDSDRDARGTAAELLRIFRNER